MIPNWKIYPRSQGHSTVYLQNVVTDPVHHRRGPHDL